MAPKPAIGVLDLGASGGRVYAAVLEEGGLCLHEIHRFTHAPQRYWQRPGEKGSPICRSCWDFPGIYEGLLEGLRRIARRGDLELLSLGVDTGGSDGTWLNTAGDMLGLIGTGRDRRWREAREEILQQVSEEELFHLTGVRSDPFCVLNQLYWYAHHQPALVAAAATYMPINSLLYYFLCGERVAEYTWMSTTQLTRPGQACYHTELFARLQLPLDKMPPLVRPGTHLGQSHAELAADLGLEPFAVIVPATHDTASAYAAAPVEPGHKPILISSGTWTLVGMEQPAPLLTEAVLRAGLTNIAGCESTYLQAIIMGSWPAQQLKHLWSLWDQREVTWETFGDLAASAPAFKTVLDIDAPLFYAPEDMEQAISQFCRQTGQEPPATRGEMARAVYEGLALSVALACERMQQVTCERADSILIVGGGTRNRLLNQWIADATGLPVFAGAENATALGNAIIQALALGWVGSLTEGRRVSGSRSVAAYTPRIDGAWERAKEQIREWRAHE